MPSRLALGHGIGLRTRHFTRFLDTRPPVDWVEVVTENFMAGGGRPLAVLEKVRRDMPVVLHGVSLSIGSVDPLSESYLDDLELLIRRVEPALVSDHLCWGSHRGRYLHDLLPLPYTGESLDHVAGRVAAVQERLGRRLFLENPSSYVAFRDSTLSEWEFLSALCRRTGCGIVLDVNNVFVSATNHGFSAAQYLAEFPLHLVREIHLAGHATDVDDGGQTLLIDAHDRPFHRSLPLAPAPWLETGTADGSIASTAADMAAYVRLLLNRGRGLLSEEGFGLLAGRLVPLPEDEGERGEFYGYGLQVGDEDGHTIVSHSGGMVGYYAAIAADLEGDLGAVALCNGPGEPMAVARRALRLVRWAREGRGLPPAPAGPERVEDAGAYAGVYRPARRETGGENSNEDETEIAVSAGGAGLELRLAGQRAALERRGADCFYAPHPALSRYLLRFARLEGQVVEAWCGPELFVRPGCAGEAAPEPPAAWRAYTGHYRCHNPWLGNFRVVLRRDRLILALPWGEEQPLVPLAEALFRVGDDERLPERLCFDTVLGGRARRANLAGCDYYRTFTP